MYHNILYLNNEYILVPRYMGKVKQINQMFRGIELKQNNADGE